MRAGSVESPVGFVVGVSALACGLLGLTSALVGFATDGRHILGPAVVGAGAAVGGAIAVRSCRLPMRIRSSRAFVGVTAMWLVQILLSTGFYRLTGTFDTWDDAVFESVSGVTTTASTVLADPEAVARSVLWWRAGTQWLGGLGALLFVVVVLPSLGVGGVDVTDAGTRHSGTSLTSRRTVRNLRQISTLYATFTVVGIGLFLVGGMGPFDAVTYAATTISTGGFANHRGSFAHFESTALEWAGVGGMVLGGANMALLFVMARRGGLTRAWRSFELRAYATILVVGTAVVSATATGAGFGHGMVRRAAFHVASAVSTTGHFVDGWGHWEVGPQTLLLVLMGVGAMSGSAGGGFRVVRAVALLGYLRRELVAQLHPRAVVPVRVGAKLLDDAVVSRMVGYQAQYLILGSLGAIAVAALGVDLLTAMGAAVSSIANVGPAVGELAPGTGGGVMELPRPARLALLPLMLLGRLEIAPVLVGVAIVAGNLRRSIRASTPRRVVRRVVRSVVGRLDRSRRAVTADGEGSGS